jgi:hypothetical protein
MEITKETKKKQGTKRRKNLEESKMRRGREEREQGKLSEDDLSRTRQVLYLGLRPLRPLNNT